MISTICPGIPKHIVFSYPCVESASARAAATTAWQVFLTWFARASSLDANQARRRLDHAAPWMIARTGWPLGLEGDHSYPIRSL